MKKTPKEELIELSSFLRGYGAALKCMEMQIAATWLSKLSEKVCAHGYIGHYDPQQNCTSDHK